MERAFDIGQFDLTRLLEQWRWLCAEPVTLVAWNAFGDLFLRTVEAKVLWCNQAFTQVCAFSRLFRGQ